MNHDPDPTDDLVRLRRALTAMQKMQSRLDALESARADPIAVIGMGCRFPGAENLQGFWRLLREGVDAISEVPRDRWDNDALYDSNPRSAGKITTRFGGFLKSVDLFDPAFFGISPREAVSLDPQQRLLLEVSWEALEHASLPADSINGSPTGVFVGISSSDYAQNVMVRDPAEIDHYMGSGNARSVAAGRLSYILGLKGPSFAVDTACSSSLVAVHLACESLRRGECTIALAAGVNVLLAPEVSISHSRAQMLAPDGRCKSFDESADGFVRSEGCGVIVLKRLSTAGADRDTVLGVILGSAINHDGRTSGLTVPSGPSQEAVIGAALKNAGVEPQLINYVETHGTGTRLGDPIEAAALSAALCRDRSSANPLVIGSVKTNIGHLEAAAGIAGLIKTILALQHQEIPRHLHLRTPNTLIPWKELPLSVAGSPMPWKPKSQRRIAGVSSFGFSGTNAHVIVAEPVAEPVNSNELELDRPCHLLTLSARTEEALFQLVDRYVERLAADPDISIADVCYSANTGRSHFAHRVGVIAETADDCRSTLKAFTERRDSPGLLKGEVLVGQRPKLAFLFTGQGSQLTGMGHELYRTQPSFRATLDRCQEVLSSRLEKPLLEVMFHDRNGSLNNTAYTQPALFVLEYALAELWRSWGVEPELMLGHSVGEYVAASIAGVFSLEDALALIAERARLMQALTVSGAMVAVRADEMTVRNAIRLSCGDVDIAAVNGPQAVVLSGATGSVERVQAVLAGQGLQSIRLQVSHAFHSHLMEPMLADFQTFASGVKYSLPRVPFVSNLTGRLASDEVATAQYWSRHVRETVRFASGMATLQEEGCDSFVEIGPRPVLLDLGRQCISKPGVAWLASLRPGRSDWQQLLHSLGTLYLGGMPVKWAAVDRDLPRRRVDLPTYPFQRQSYWLKASKNNGGRSDRRDTGDSVRVHPLLGRRCWMADSGEIRFEASISSDSPSYLRDHCVFDVPIFPASGYLEMALAAGSDFFHSDQLSVENVAFRQPLLLDEPKLVQFVLRPEGEAQASFRIYSLAGSVTDGSAILHASGVLNSWKDGHERLDRNLADLRARAVKKVPLDGFYENFNRCGVNFGPAFQALTELWQATEYALARMELPEIATSELNRYQIHPVLLDAASRVSAVFSLTSASDTTLLQTSIERIRYFGPARTPVWASARLRSIEDGWVADVELLDERGFACLSIEGQAAKIADSAAILGHRGRVRKEQFYEMQWQPRSRIATAASPAGIAAAVNEKIAEVAADPKLVAYGAFLGELDLLATAYVLKTFASEVGPEFSLASASERLSVIPKHRRFLKRLIGMLEESGLLERHDETWQMIPAPSIVDPRLEIGRLTEKFPFGRTELSLVEDCGSRLAQVLRGDCDPLEFLFPKGDVGRIGTLYEDSAGAGATHAVVQRAMQQAVRSLPEGKPLRILEIGAGTGATTTSVLPVLAMDRTQYVYTDVSSRFLTHAQARFQQYPFVQYRVLDIERPPAEQGFESARYDLVLATNVLHATADLRQTLVHVRDLLADSGTLILLEGTSPACWLDLVFGMLEGWWRFVDTDLRPSHPLIPVSRWKQLLTETGFAEVADASGDGEAHIGKQSVLIARRAPRTATVGPTSGTPSWLILADPSPFTERLAGMLSASGQSVCFLDEGNLQHAISEQAGSIRGVIHLSEQDKDTESSDLRNSKSLLDLAQRLLKVSGSTAKLWIVTRDAQPVGPSPGVTGLKNAVVWGIGKVFALEHPHLWGGMIDLPRDAADDEAARLVEELLQPDGEDHIAYRSGQRYVARLAPHNLRQRLPFVVQQKATHLITGGLGAFGLEAAQWLVSQGARHIVLIGRQGAATMAAQLGVKKLEEAGAKVAVFEADVADVTDMRRVFDTFRSWPPLKGVVHAAGVPGSCAIEQLSLESLKAAFAPKVAGTWLLHEFTKDMSLDFFVLCSSMVSVWGAKGQADYVAANQFMDAFAYYRRALGLPALSVNWGPLTGGGMLPDEYVADLSRMGVATTKVADAVRMLKPLLQSGSVQTIPVDIQWDQFKSVYEVRGRRPLFENISGKDGPPAVRAPKRQAHLLDELSQAPSAERLHVLQTHLQQTIADVLRLDTPRLPDPRLGFFSMGMDSLTAMELRDRLESQLGIPLPSTVALDYSTVDSLSTFLLSKVNGIGVTLQPQAPIAEDNLSPLAKRLLEMSEEQVEELLLKKLAGS